MEHQHVQRMLKFMFLVKKIIFDKNISIYGKLIHKNFWVPFFGYLFFEYQSSIFEFWGMTETDFWKTNPKKNIEKLYLTNSGVWHRPISGKLIQTIFRNFFKFFRMTLWMSFPEIGPKLKFRIKISIKNDHLKQKK